MHPRPRRLRLRRQLRLLQGYVLFSALGMVVLSAAAFRQAQTTTATATATAQKFDEITVQRLNVVDANGTLRMVLANKDRMHPGVLDGVTINRPRPVAGLIFFNDLGDEVGGLTWSGQDTAGQPRAHGLLAFDQFKQDQTVAISYSESNGQRAAGLEVWDRPESKLSELISKLNDANAITDPAAREKAVGAVRASAPPAPRRVFVGKRPDRSAVVALADANGKPRLTLSVAPDGTAGIEFLDADGKVVQRLPSR